MANRKQQDRPGEAASNKDRNSNAFAYAQAAFVIAAAIGGTLFALWLHYVRG